MKKFIIAAFALASLSSAALASQRDSYNPDGSPAYGSDTAGVVTMTKTTPLLIKKVSPFAMELEQGITMGGSVRH